MFEQKRRLRKEEIEWQHRQQQVKQQKREVQQELFQFRQKLLQQKELEKDDALSKVDIVFCFNTFVMLPRSKFSQLKSFIIFFLKHKEKDTKENQKNEQSETLRMSPKSRMTLPPFSYPSMYSEAPQVPYMSTMFSPSRLPHHEMFYPPGFMPHSQLTQRMDPRVYKDYLQQSTRAINDENAVNEWLEKQKYYSKLIANNCLSPLFT